MVVYPGIDFSCTFVEVPSSSSSCPVSLFMPISEPPFFFPDAVREGFLFTGLSVFSWVCWVAPKNVPVNQLFGAYSGLGMSLVTFDWSQIAWIGSPLMIPWWAEVHVFAGFVLFYWIMVPILYYTNVSRLPLNLGHTCLTALDRRGIWPISPSLTTSSMTNLVNNITSPGS